MKPGWRHHLFKTVGDGSFTPVAWDVPVSGAGLTLDLSGPSAFDGSVNPEIPRLKEQVIVQQGQDFQQLGVNLAENPRFASLDYQWGGAPMWQNPNLAYAVDNGLRVTSLGSGDAGFELLNDDSTDSSVAGKTYTFGIDVTRLAAGGFVQAAVGFVRGSWSGPDAYAHRSAEVPNTPGTHRITVSGSVPEDADHLVVALILGPSSEPVWFDRVSIEEGATSGEYFDGDTTDGATDEDPHYRWVGTAGTSASEQYLPAIEPVIEYGDPLIQNWQSVIVSERDGQIKGVSIIRDSPVDDGEMSLTGIGFAGYPTGLAFTDVFKGIEVDPIDQVRRIWSHLQGHPGGDLGVVVDDTKAPRGVTIGAEEKDVSFETGEGEQVEFQSGPFVLAWYQTDDCGKEIDDLAEFTPFDYRMEHEWSGDTFTSFLRIGTPKIGVRRNGLRFVVGENIIDMPGLERAGDDYANEVLVLGSGEASKMRRGTAKRVPDRLRRVAVVADKSKRSNAAAAKLAENELKNRLGDPDITEITVMDHPNARFNTWSLGDEILVTTPDGWLKPMRLWCRVVSEQWNCDEDTLTLTLKKV